jgi:hypothetical protein
MLLLSLMRLVVYTCGPKETNGQSGTICTEQNAVRNPDRLGPKSAGADSFLAEQMGKKSILRQLPYSVPAHVGAMKRVVPPIDLVELFRQRLWIKLDQVARTTWSIALSSWHPKHIVADIRTAFAVDSVAQRTSWN